MGKNTKKKNNKPTLGELIQKAVEVSGENKVLNTVSLRCGSFNDISGLKEYIEKDLSPEDRSTRGWLTNSLKKLGKEPKVNKYAHFSKISAESHTFETG